MPKLSIITINLNNAYGLAKTFDSIEKQTTRDFEYVIVDGGSNDGSSDMINNASGIVSQSIIEEDKGIFDAMNKGAKISSGDYLLFLNSGDRLADSSIIKSFNNFMFNEELISGDVMFELESGFKYRLNSPINPSEMFFLAESLQHCSTFIKKTLFDSLGAYSLRYKITSDYDFFLKAITNNRRSYRRWNRVVSVFAKGGASHDEYKGSVHHKERNELIEKYMYATPLKLFYAKFIYKKARYSLSLLKSLILPGFMKGDLI